MVSDKRTFSSDSVGYLLHLASRAMAKALQRRLAPHDVGIGQWPILMILWEQEGLTQTGLAKKIGIEGSTMTNTLDRMERDQLVRRELDAESRRTQRIFLTARGRALEARLLPLAAQVNELSLKGVTAAEAKTFKKVLRAIVTQLEAEG